MAAPSVPIMEAISSPHNYLPAVRPPFTSFSESIRRSISSPWDLLPLIKVSPGAPTCQPALHSFASAVNTVNFAPELPSCFPGRSRASERRSVSLCPEIASELQPSQVVSAAKLLKTSGTRRSSATDEEKKVQLLPKDKGNISGGVKMVLTEEPTRSKVWSVFFRHAKFGMLMLNMGSKLVAVFVVLVIVGTTRDSGVDEATTQGTSSGPTIRSRRELREYVPPATCPFDFSQTPFPMTISLCSLPDVWSESCCAAIRNDFLIPAFGQNIESIPDSCIAAVEARLLQEQLEIKYSSVCGSDDVLSDPVLRRGQPGDNQMQTAPEYESAAQFETVVSQLMYSEESLEEIPGDTRPVEERSVESPEETEEEKRGEKVRPNVVSRPWGWKNGSDSSNDGEGQELSVTVTGTDGLRRELPVVSV